MMHEYFNNLYYLSLHESSKVYSSTNPIKCQKSHMHITKVRCQKNVNSKNRDELNVNTLFHRGHVTYLVNTNLLADIVTGRPKPHRKA